MSNFYPTSSELMSWEFWVGTLIFCLFAYLIGSINFGYIMGKVWSRDIGKEGSNNYGATNAGRVFGAKGFAIVFFADFSKGMLIAITLVCLNLYTTTPIFTTASVGVAAAFAVVGHIYPVWFKFKGGKGVAITLGILLILNWMTTLLLLSFFAISLIFTCRVSLSATLSALLMILFAWIMPYYVNPQIIATFPNFFFANQDLSISIGTTIIGILVLISHIPNIKKIINKTDSGGYTSLRRLRYKLFHFGKEMPEELYDKVNAVKE